MSFLLIPILIASCSGSQGLNKKKSAATDEDLFLYRAIGSSLFCNARSAGVEYPRAIGVSAGTYAEVINGRHDGLVASVGEEKLTRKQLERGAEFQVVTGALQYCPEHVPDDIKTGIQEGIKKMRSQEAIKKQK